MDCPNIGRCVNNNPLEPTFLLQDNGVCHRYHDMEMRPVSLLFREWKPAVGRDGVLSQRHSNAKRWCFLFNYPELLSVDKNSRTATYLRRHDANVSVAIWIYMCTRNWLIRFLLVQDRIRIDRANVITDNISTLVQMVA